MVAERGDIVDRATDIVEQMLDDVVAVAPTDPKGQAIVPRLGGRLPHVHRGPSGVRRRPPRRRQRRRSPRRPSTASRSATSWSVFAADNQMPDCSPRPSTSS